MEFHGTVELGGKTATGIAVPAEVVAALGGGNRPAVTVTLHGHLPDDGRAHGRPVPRSAERRPA